MPWLSLLLLCHFVQPFRCLSAGTQSRPGNSFVRGLWLPQSSLDLVPPWILGLRIRKAMRFGAVCLTLTSPISCQYASHHSLPIEHFHNSFVTHPPFRFSVELLPPWMLGIRVGEALKPGPTRFAIINPTSIISKISQFDALANQRQVDIVCASETAATSKAQRLFSRQLRSVCHFKSLWSAPVSNQFDRLDVMSVFVVVQLVWGFLADCLADMH